ncbi:MAG: DedA family protein [Acidimicrobiia bacterium]|nr:DedA family protein [Acidimicrobiia bacterium]
MFDQLTEWVTDVVASLGYGGVAFLVALESVFPPIPSEVVLPLAGFVAGRGEASVVGMVIAATIGSVVGAWALYLIAAAIGPVRLRRMVARYGRWFRIDEDDVARAEGWFDRRGGTAVLICRCIPLVRSLVSIPAGFRRMEAVRFTLLTTLGSAVWNIALISAGYALGERWEEVGDYVSYLQYALYVAVAGGVGWFVWRRFVSPRARSDVPS